MRLSRSPAAPAEKWERQHPRKRQIFEVAELGQPNRHARVAVGRLGPGGTLAYEAIGVINSAAIAAKANIAI